MPSRQPGPCLKIPEKVAPGEPVAVRGPACAGRVSGAGGGAPGRCAPGRCVAVRGCAPSRRRLSARPAAPSSTALPAPGWTYQAWCGPVTGLAGSPPGCGKRRRTQGGARLVPVPAWKIRFAPLPPSGGLGGPAARFRRHPWHSPRALRSSLRQGRSSPARKAALLRRYASLPPPSDPASAPHSAPTARHPDPSGNRSCWQRGRNSPPCQPFQRMPSVAGGRPARCPACAIHGSGPRPRT